MTRRDYSEIPRGEFGFINLLRGPAALLVVYSHFVGQYLSWTHQTYWLKRWVDALFEKPMVIVDHFGQLGVMVFFLISGFIITHVARSENPLRFSIRRVFRIYPAYWLVVAVVIGFGLFDIPFDYGALHDWRNVLRIATITNYLHEPQNVVLGVAWTLQIEVMFYALVACVTPLIRRRPLVALCVELAFVYAVIASAHRAGPDWFLFAANVAYLPYLLIGQAIYFYWAGGLNGPRALALGWLAYFAAVYGVWNIHIEFLDPSHSRILGLIFALGIFVWAMNYGHRIGLMRVPRFLSDISYSLYLVHGPVGLSMIEDLRARIGYGNAAALALVTSLALAYIIHRFIERPFIEMGRRLSNRFKKTPQIAPA